MNTDQFGVSHFSSDEICELLYQNPDINLLLLNVDDPDEYNMHVNETYADFDLLKKYEAMSGSIVDFDRYNQNDWFMPDEYKEFDIAKWVLDQCIDDPELQRAAQELLIFQERNLFPLLCYLKYMVDTFRKNKVVWGVGRGSSVASFVLYKIGVHKINSLYFDLSIEEFLK